MSGPMHDRGGYEDRETLRAQINALTDELDRLRERVSSHPHDIAMLERRLADARSDARTTASNNERLAATLREARDQIISLKSEVDRLARPTSTPPAARCGSASAPTSTRRPSSPARR